MVEGLFVDVDDATLATMKAEWQAALTAIATGQQSYSIAGRSFTRADLVEVKMMVAEIAFAIATKAGTKVRRVYSDMSNG